MSTLSVDTIQGQTTAANVKMPAGYVIQTVNTQSDTAATTVSTSFVSTSVAATITPKYNTSKILVICQCALHQTTTVSNGSHVAAQIHRGSTAIGFQVEVGTREGSGGGFVDNAGAGNILSVLDSPSTTSATTYTVYMKALSNVVTSTINRNSQGSTITLMEIAQ